MKSGWPLVPTQNFADWTILGTQLPRLVPICSTSLSPPRRFVSKRIRSGVQNTCKHLLPELNRLHIGCRCVLLKQDTSARRSPVTRSGRSHRAPASGASLLFVWRRYVDCQLHAAGRSCRSQPSADPAVLQRCVEPTRDVCFCRRLRHGKSPNAHRDTAQRS